MSRQMLTRLITALALMAPVALLVTGGDGLVPPGVSWT